MSKDKKRTDRYNVQISESFSYRTHYDNAKLITDACDYYKNNIMSMFEMLSPQNGNAIISFDTNFLLRLYGMPVVSRDEILKFIGLKSKNIIIASHVVTELIKNSDNISAKFKKTLRDEIKNWNTIISDINRGLSAISGKIQQVQSSNILRNSVSAECGAAIEELINRVVAYDINQENKDKMVESATKIKELLEDSVQGIIKEISYGLDDPILRALSNVVQLDPLTKPELDFLDEHYSTLLEGYNKKKISSTEKSRYVFPGCGDRKKEENQNGDFIIYHELIKWMRANNKNVYFFTNDVKKSDWLDENGIPYRQTIVDTYHNTGHMLYVLDAADFPVDFKQIFDDTQNVVSDDSIDEHTENNTGTNDECQPDEVLCSGGDETEANEVSGINDAHRIYKRITKERFLSELKVLTLWAHSYGAGYVAERYFIYNILGNKRFDYKISKSVLAELVSEGKIKVEGDSANGKKLIILNE